MSSQTRILEPGEIKKLMEDDEARLDSKRKWPQDDEKRLILAAMKDKKSFVILKGKRFDFRYSVDDSAFLTSFKSTGQFSPCGWFTLAGLEKALLGTKESDGKQKA